VAGIDEERLEHQAVADFPECSLLSGAQRRGAFQAAVPSDAVFTGVRAKRAAFVRDAAAATCRSAARGARRADLAATGFRCAAVRGAGVWPAAARPRADTIGMRRSCARRTGHGSARARCAASGGPAAGGGAAAGAIASTRCSSTGSRARVGVRSASAVCARVPGVAVRFATRRDGPCDCEGREGATERASNEAEAHASDGPHGIFLFGVILGSTPVEMVG
jgi:hypothetical protein